MRISPCVAFLMLSFFACRAEEQADILIPVSDSKLVIRSARFTPSSARLSFRTINFTNKAWTTVKLRFDIGALCNGTPKQWAIIADTWTGWNPSGPSSSSYAEDHVELGDQISACQTKIIRAELIFASSSSDRVDGPTRNAIDLVPELTKIKGNLDREEAERLKSEQAQKKADADRAATMAARRRRLRDEQRKKDAENAAREQRRLEAEESARRIEVARVRSNCRAIYEKTADKKIKDLTVREEQAVRACQALGLYPPL